MRCQKCGHDMEMVFERPTLKYVCRIHGAQWERRMAVGELEIRDVFEINPQLAYSIHRSGLKTVEDVRKAGRKKLLRIRGITRRNIDRFIPQDKEKENG